MQKHEFNDKTSRLQLFSKGQKTEFLNFEREEDSVVAMMEGESTFYRARFYLDSKKVVQNRRTYAFFTFLGDAGGIYASVFAIGAFINWFVSKQAFSMVLLRDHFTTDEGQLGVYTRESISMCDWLL